MLRCSRAPGPPCTQRCMGWQKVPKGHSMPRLGARKTKSGSRFGGWGGGPWSPFLVFVRGGGLGLCLFIGFLRHFLRNIGPTAGGAWTAPWWSLEQGWSLIASFWREGSIFFDWTLVDFSTKPLDIAQLGHRWIQSPKLVAPLGSPSELQKKHAACPEPGTGFANVG